MDGWLVGWMAGWIDSWLDGSMDCIKVSDNLQRQMEHLPDVTDTVSIWGEKAHLAADS